MQTQGSHGPDQLMTFDLHPPQHRGRPVHVRAKIDEVDRISQHYCGFRQRLPGEVAGGSHPRRQCFPTGMHSGHALFLVQATEFAITI